MTKSYANKDLLNRLHEMQQSPYYATSCHDLIKAEMAIVQLDDMLEALQAENAKQATDHIKTIDTIAKQRDAALARERHTRETLHKFMEAGASPVEPSQAWDALREWGCTGKDMSLATIMQRGDDLANALRNRCAQPVQPASNDKHWCETCDGGGTIDETLGGEHFSNPKAECPDCDGNGYWIRRSQPVQPAKRVS